MKVDSPVGGYFLPVVPPVSFLKKGMTNLRCPVPRGCKRLIVDLGQKIFHYNGLQMVTHLGMPQKRGGCSKLQF
jgi:hypothetical protein